MNYYQRMIVMGFLDTVMVALAVLFAYLLRFDFQIKPVVLPTLPYVIGAHVVLTLIIFRFLRIYKRVWQHASIGELMAIVKSFTLVEVLFYALHHAIRLFEPTLSVPRSIYPLSWALMIMVVGGSRFFWRMLSNSYVKIQSYHRRTLIISALSGGFYR
jgi:FlaA1/EpsC-like NDP-sugar epimerase